MSEPTLFNISTKLDKLDRRLDHIERSQRGTDETVTALYAALVGTTPNVRDRLRDVENNLAKIIERTPGGADLPQPVYDT